jgi:hypothetical protein
MGIWKLPIDFSENVIILVVTQGENKMNWLKKVIKSWLFPTRLPAGFKPASEYPNSNRDVRVFLSSGKVGYGWNSRIRLWYVYVGPMWEFDLVPDGTVIGWAELEDNNE